MTPGIYEAFAYAMRYWFIAVAVGVLIAMISISFKEYKSRKSVRDELSSYIGYLEIVGGPEEFIGDRFGIGEYTVIGSSDGASIVLPDPTVAANHADLQFDGRKLMIAPGVGCTLRINGRRAVRAYPLKTGDVVSVGDVEMAVYIRKKRVGYDR